MKHTDCPKCDKIVHDEHCSACGTNAALHNMAQNMSNRYYNLGLKYAKQNNLSVAVKKLNTALEVNKKNIDARNLLGLCFYARGQIGEALREWVISSNYKESDNAAKQYLNDFNNNLSALEKYSEALIKYNEALTYMEQNSEDLAVIRLKRSVELLPNFVDALNLLAMHHLKIEDKAKASALVERVLEIDKGNAFAKRYYFEIFQKNPSEKNSVAPRSFGRANASLQKSTPEKPTVTGNPFAARTQKPVAKPKSLSSIVSVASGMLVMFLFMYILIIPGMMSDRDDRIGELTTDIQNMQVSQSQSVAGLQQVIDAHQNEITRLNEEANRITEEGINMQHSMKVYDAQRLLDAGNPSQALEILQEIEVLRLTETLVAQYAEIRLTATPLAQQQYFAAGTQFFNQGNFAAATENLLQAVRHSVPNTSIGGDSLYWLGRIAQYEGNISQAIEYYRNAVDNFPAFTRRWSAVQRLNNLS